MLQQQQTNVEGFQPIKPPHHELFAGGNRPPHQGAYGSSSSLSQKADNFHGREANTLSHSEALAYLENTYGSKSITVDGNLKISDWQAAKKIYHGGCFGIKPEDYGAKQSDLHRLNQIGIVDYVKEGGRLPSHEHIRAYQNALKDFCEGSTSSKNKKSTFQGSPSITFYDKTTRQVAIYNPDTGDFISGYKISKPRSQDYQTRGNIGNLPKK